jgi:hypothetical protein
MSMSVSLVIVDPSAAGFELATFPSATNLMGVQNWTYNSTKFVFTSPLNVYIHPFLSAMYDYYTDTPLTYRIRINATALSSSYKLILTTDVNNPIYYGHNIS